MKICIINGVNLNLLGKREPEIYGKRTFEDYLEQLKKEFQQIDFCYFQSNIEGEIVNFLHKVGFQVNGIILNAGAYTHYSYAIFDAIRSIKSPVIEVHISNIFQREDFRHKSVIAPACIGTISGFGMMSYKLAVIAFLELVG